MRPPRLHPQPDQLRTEGDHRRRDLGRSATTAPLTERFQVGGCQALGFKPKLAISLKGSTKHAGHPALKAVLTYPKGGAYANIASAQVTLPHSEFIDQGNLNKTCTRPVLLAGACPASSVYGKAKAWTPLLEKPLEGPVYLVGGFGYKLPALVAELDGQIRVLLVGKVDSGKNKGIRNTFEAVPDAPVEKFVLEMKGGHEVLPARKLRKPLRQAAEGDRELHRPETARTARARAQSAAQKHMARGLKAVQEHSRHARRGPRFTAAGHGGEAGDDQRRPALLPFVLAAALAATSPAQRQPPDLPAPPHLDHRSRRRRGQLHAEINPEGIATTYRFEYLTDAAYQANLPSERFAGAAEAPRGATRPSAGSSALRHGHPVGQRPERPPALYRYRVVATSGAGTTSASEPPSPPSDLGGGPSHARTSRLPRLGDGLPGRKKRRRRPGPRRHPRRRRPPGRAPAKRHHLHLLRLLRRSPGRSARQPVPLPRAGLRLGHPEHHRPRPSPAPTAPTRRRPLPALLPRPLPRPDARRGRCRGEGTNARSQPAPGGIGALRLQNYYLRDNASGASRPCSPTPSARSALSAETRTAPRRRHPDLVHVVLSTCAALTPRRPKSRPGAGAATRREPTSTSGAGHRWRSSTSSPARRHGTPGARWPRRAARSPPTAPASTSTRSGNLYLREARPSRPRSSAAEAAFQTASADGSLAFFTKAGHLYRYLAGAEASTDLTPAGGVVGVLGASEDGSTSTTDRVRPLPLATRRDHPDRRCRSRPPSDYPPATGTARVSADGARLAFLSTEALTGYDNTDQRPAGPMPRSTSTQRRPAQLVCVSCNPTGERPLGPSTIPGAIANGTAPTPPTLQAARPLRRRASPLLRLASTASCRTTPTPPRTSTSGRPKGQGSCPSRQAASA